MEYAAWMQRRPDGIVLDYLFLDASFASSKTCAAACSSHPASQGDAP